MAELVHDAQHEFWRPPIAQHEVAAPAMLEACDSCGTEFILSARFCHACGAARQTQHALAHLYLSQAGFAGAEDDQLGASKVGPDGTLGAWTDAEIRQALEARGATIRQAVRAQRR